jgi:hypothetical protein
MNLTSHGVFGTFIYLSRQAFSSSLADTIILTCESGLVVIIQWRANGVRYELCEFMMGLLELLDCKLCLALDHDPRHLYKQPTPFPWFCDFHSSSLGTR